MRGASRDPRCKGLYIHTVTDHACLDMLTTYIDQAEWEKSRIIIPRGAEAEREIG